MKEAPPKSLLQSKLRQEADKQDQGTCQLHTKASENDQFLQPDNTFHLVEAQCLGHHHALLQSHLSPQQEDHQGCGRHKAQTADFDHRQDHTLTKSAPLRPGIKEHQSRHAGSRGGSKQRRKEAAAFSTAGGSGQAQQSGTCQDNACENQCDNLCGV